MRIERIELRELSLRLRERFEISSGWTEARRIVLVSLQADGCTGWGECVQSESPNYSYETTETAWHILTDFVLPALVGLDAAEPSDVLGPVEWIRGHRMALAGVEMAAWDLWAKLNDIPLAEAIGGSVRALPVGVSIGLQPNDDDLLRKIEGYLAEGYAKIKLKIKPGRDVEMLARVRERFPDAPLMADANSAYTLGDAPRLTELDDLGLLMIEQPLAHDDYLDHARLQERMSTPICLDESIRSLGDARLAAHLKACKIINIKPGRVGGFRESVRIHDFCREVGMPVWCGGMLESGVGRAHNLALASLPGFTLPGDISASRRYWEQDIVTPEFELTDGTMQVPPGVGIGVEPDLERIDAITVRSAAFR